jgi:hypothetical protein
MITSFGDSQNFLVLLWKRNEMILFLHNFAVFGVKNAIFSQSISAKIS